MEKLDLGVKENRIREFAVLPKEKFDIGTIGFSKAANAIDIAGAVGLASVISTTNTPRRPKKVILPSSRRFVIFILRLSRKY